MSTLWSGRVCWAAVSALQTSQATAYNAIITSIAEDCLWDVSLDIPHVDFMPGRDSWDDLECEV